jgi:hypothetical protein
MEKDQAQAYANEVSSALTALEHRDCQKCFVHLERAHIIGQRSIIKHTYAHMLMLVAGLRCRDFREVLGQIPRIVTSVLFSRIWVPVGNTGRARVSAVKPMSIPDDLRHLVTARHVTPTSSSTNRPA